MTRNTLVPALAAVGLLIAASAEAARAETVEVTATALNVRSGPSTRYRVVGVARRGQRFAVTGRSGAWRRISAGWLHSAYTRVVSGAAAAPAPVAAAPERPRSRAGFIQLRASGPGYAAYSAASGRWGVPRFIYAIERAARRWKAEGRRARLRVGDISRENGGYFYPHVSHRVGKDADISPLRNDGRELPVTRFDRAYSRALTAHAIQLLRNELRPSLVLFNDRGVGGVTYWPGHDNHFHYRVP
ncbi:MAG: SH3 domain-containing protein [Planctomycetota bacterium]